MEQGESEKSEPRDGFYEKTERLAKKLSQSIREDFVPEAEKKIKENPFLTILIFFLSGAFLAFILFSGGKRGQ